MTSIQKALVSAAIIVIHTGINITVLTRPDATVADHFATLIAVQVVSTFVAVLAIIKIACAPTRWSS